MCYNVCVNRLVPIQSELGAICGRFGVRRLSLFGSVLRGQETSTSDVDLLVEFIPGRTPDLFTLAELERELSSLFGGRAIDLRTSEDLSRHFRAEVISSAELLYAA
ncbi:MAG TPA: nucleotidyltransferase family protein [Tepidisphaeraceae bacterium]|nr:nucleotidyltransferase family protein [Tepidisphaeraceae bacterium]